MKRVLLALALTSNVMAEPLVTIPAYKDTTGFYAHVRCSGESLYEVCPTKIEVNCCVEAPKQIHLPRTTLEHRCVKLTLTRTTATATGYNNEYSIT
jgi:hypothetical protein